MSGFEVRLPDILLAPQVPFARSKEFWSLGTATMEPFLTGLESLTSAQKGQIHVREGSTMQRFISGNEQNIFKKKKK